MSQDKGLLLRIAACMAKEGVVNAVDSARASQWALAASPGWDEAYEYATLTLPNSLSSIGEREDVITDWMILSAVQTLLARNDAQVEGKVIDTSVLKEAAAVEAEAKEVGL